MNHTTFYILQHKNNNNDNNYNNMNHTTFYIRQHKNNNNYNISNANRTMYYITTSETKPENSC